MSTNYFKIKNVSGKTLTLVLKAKSPGANVHFKNGEKPSTYGSSLDGTEMGFSLAGINSNGIMLAKLTNIPGGDEEESTFDPIPSMMIVTLINKDDSIDSLLLGGPWAPGIIDHYKSLPNSNLNIYDLAQKNVLLYPISMDNGDTYLLVFNGSSTSSLGMSGRWFTEANYPSNNVGPESEVPMLMSVDIEHSPDAYDYPVRNLEEVMSKLGFMANGLPTSDDMSTNFTVKHHDEITNFGFLLGENDNNSPIASMVSWHFEYPNWDDPRDEIVYGLAYKLNDGPVIEHTFTIVRGEVPEAKWSIWPVMNRIREELSTIFNNSDLIHITNNRGDFDMIEASASFIMDIDEYPYIEHHILSKNDESWNDSYPLTEDWTENSSPYSLNGNEEDDMSYGWITIRGFYTFDTDSETEETVMNPQKITFVPNHPFSVEIDYDLAINSSLCNPECFITDDQCGEFTVYSTGNRSTMYDTQPEPPSMEI